MICLGKIRFCTMKNSYWTDPVFHNNSTSQKNSVIGQRPLCKTIDNKSKPMSVKSGEKPTILRFFVFE